MISYDGTIYFGLAGDRDVVPDLDDLVGALREALREQPVPRRPAKRRAAAPKRKAAAKRKARNAPAKGKARMATSRGKAKKAKGR